MGTVVSNNRVGPRLERDVAAIDTTVNSGTINAGDNTYFTGAGVASLLAASGLTAAIITNIGNYAGVSRDTYPIPVSDGLTETVSSGLQATASLDVSGLFNFKTTAADSLKPGTPVTIGADAQTVAVAPVGPSMSGASASGTGGTWAAAAHTLQATFVASIGETLAGVSASVTPTAGQNIVSPAVTPPAWALGVAFYVDGLFAGFSASGAATTLAGPNANPRALPTSNALAIGVVAHDQTPVGGSLDTTITGAAGQNVVVRIQPKV